MKWQKRKKLRRGGRSSCPRGHLTSTYPTQGVKDHFFKPTYQKQTLNVPIGHQKIWKDLSAHPESQCFRFALRLDAVNRSHIGTNTLVNAWPLTHWNAWYTGAVTFVDRFISESRCCRRDDPRDCQGRVTEGQFLFTSCNMAHVPLSQESEKSSQHCWQFSSRSVKHCIVKNQVEPKHIHAVLLR